MASCRRKILSFIYLLLKIRLNGCSSALFTAFASMRNSLFAHKSSAGAHTTQKWSCHSAPHLPTLHSKTNPYRYNEFPIILRCFTTFRHFFEHIVGIIITSSTNKMFVVGFREQLQKASL